MIDPRLNRSWEIPPEAVDGGIFDRVLNFDNCQPEVASDDISGVVVDPTGMDVVSNLVILGQTVLEIYDCLTLWQTTPEYAGHHTRLKRHAA